MADGDGGIYPKDAPLMWDPTDDIECFIPIDPEYTGAPEWFDRVSPPSARSEAIWAETARRMGVSDA